MCICLPATPYPTLPILPTSLHFPPHPTPLPHLTILTASIPSPIPPPALHRPLRSRGPGPTWAQSRLGLSPLGPALGYGVWLQSSHIWALGE